MSINTEFKLMFVTEGKWNHSLNWIKLYLQNNLFRLSRSLNYKEIRAI